MGSLLNVSEVKNSLQITPMVFVYETLLKLPKHFKTLKSRLLWSVGY